MHIYIKNQIPIKDLAVILNNSKNEKVDITVKEYQEALENNDYTCVEK